MKIILLQVNKVIKDDELSGGRFYLFIHPSTYTTPASFPLSYLCRYFVLISFITMYDNTRSVHVCTYVRIIHWECH